MDKQSTVVFRNVGQLYFPQTKVECHYSLNPEHKWCSSDWVGIFQVGWDTLKQYHTYTWALAPEGYTEGTSVNCCTIFQAYYLPKPSPTEYQFVYVDRDGEVCACSRPFTFNAPKPLEELETLKEEREEGEEEEEGGDGGEEMLLVIPKAELLKSQLEESLKKQAGLQEALDAAAKEAQEEKEKSKKLQVEWEKAREELSGEISALKDGLKQRSEMLRAMEGKHKSAKCYQENLMHELSDVMNDKGECKQRIKELEEEIKALKEAETEAKAEMERHKERVKNMSSQMRHHEDKTKNLQDENEAGLVEVRGLQDRLDLAEHVNECLRREMRDQAARQVQTYTELHQTRLQVAQLNLQLTEGDMELRKERTALAQERETHKHAAEAEKKKLQELLAEVQRKDKWLQEERMEREKMEVETGLEREYNRVLLNDAGRELQEQREALIRLCSEKEEQQLEKEELQNNIHELEGRLGPLSETEPVDKETPAAPPSPECEEEEEEKKVPPPVFPRSLSAPVFLLTHLGPSQTHDQSQDDTQAPDTQMEINTDERRELILPQVTNPLFSDLADSAW